jgi:hypothetical protein
MIDTVVHSSTIHDSLTDAIPICVPGHLYGRTQDQLADTLVLADASAVHIRSMERTSLEDSATIRGLSFTHLSDGLNWV